MEVESLFIFTSTQGHLGSVFIVVGQVDTHREHEGVPEHVVLADAADGVEGGESAEEHLSVEQQPGCPGGGLPLGFGHPDQLEHLQSGGGVAADHQRGQLHCKLVSVVTTAAVVTAVLQHRGPHVGTVLQAGGQGVHELGNVGVIVEVSACPNYG